MQFDQVSVPEVYKSSEDFRFFLRWFACALERVKYDIENLLDLYDPLRCPSNLLWMLGDTMGYRYDDRTSIAFNRAVILYFMSLIRNKGSKDGLTLAAELNLKQFDIQTVAEDGYTDSSGNFVPPKEILWERLDDTSIPVNSVRVTPHVEEGYIDVVYFSSQVPTDVCTEYVRPVGMYMFSYPGVKFESNTRVSVDARLTDMDDVGMSLGPTHVGHYRRDDYARLQRIEGDEVQGHVVSSVLNDTRHTVWYRNSKYEDLEYGDGSYESGTAPRYEIDPGYRSLYSLQLCNNEHITQSLFRDAEGHPVNMDQIFRLGFKHSTEATPDTGWNLLYNQNAESALGTDVYTLSSSSASSPEHPIPAVGKPMLAIGDAIPLNDSNTEWSANHDEGAGPTTRPTVDDE